MPRNRIALRRRVASKWRAGALALSLVALTACSSTPDYTDLFGSEVFLGSHGDARNSANSTLDGSRELDLAWSRPIGAPVTSGLAVSSSGLVFTTAATESGCNVFAYQLESGRKKFCSKISPASFASRPITDNANNVYVGDDGAILSFADYGPARWRTELVGSPIGSQFLQDGNLLVLTQLGEVSVLNRHNGEKVAAPLLLLGERDFLENPNFPAYDPTVGLDDCLTGGRWCPAATVPAIDLAAGRIVLTLWRPNEPEASVVSLRYTAGDKPRLTQEWSAPVLSEGTAISPVISPDGNVVYIADNAGTLRALDAATGKTKWEHKLGFTPQYGLSVRDGLVIPGGSDGYLVAVNDQGDKAEVAWERKDVQLRGAPLQTSGDTGYIVAADGETGLQLVTFDVTNGETKRRNALPGATGTTLTTSIGPDGEVITVTVIGEVFTFKHQPAKSGS